MASPGLRDARSPSVLRVEEFEARLSEREAHLRAGLSDLETQLAELEAFVASGCAGPVEHAALRAAFETLRRELDCIVSARSAVATLRPGAGGLDLAARRAAQDGAKPGAGSVPRDRGGSGRQS